MYWSRRSCEWIWNEFWPFLFFSSIRGADGSAPRQIYGLWCSVELNTWAEYVCVSCKNKTINFNATYEPRRIIKNLYNTASSYVILLQAVNILTSHTLCSWIIIKFRRWIRSVISWQPLTSVPSTRRVAGRSRFTVFLNKHDVLKSKNFRVNRKKVVN